LSTSDTRNGRRRMFQIALFYLAVSLFCVICGLVIHGLVHAWYGVSNHSDYLTLGFAYPLVGGAAVYLLIGAVKKARVPGPFVTGVYYSGIATLTLGSMLRGTLEVAGKSSTYLPVFVVAGALMVTIGAVCHVAAQFRKPREALIAYPGTVSDHGQEKRDK
jgi:hypothetical protein